MKVRQQLMTSFGMFFTWLGIGVVISNLALLYGGFDFSCLWITLPGAALSSVMLRKKKITKPIAIGLVVAGVLGALFAYSGSAVRHSMAKQTSD